ncbi:small ubiquitin like modifier 2a isoform 1-T2 [Tautogolabrus adspersus]
MGPDTESVPKTSSSDEGPGIIVVKVISDSDSEDALCTAEPENSKQSESNPADKCHPCSVCGKVFDRPSKLERHKPVHKREPKTVHQCEHCEKSFTQREKLIRHQSSHNRTNKHPCPDCGKVFNRPSRLERHKRTHSKKPKEGVKTENNEHINLKVAGQDGSVVQFKIKRHTPLSKLMKAYCERQGLAMRQIRFRFDGQPINETDTPSQLEMEDEDTIDVFQQQTGGSSL